MINVVLSEEINRWFDLGGGTGFVGQRLVRLLRDKGFQNIWIVSRKADGKTNTLAWVDFPPVRIEDE